MENQAPCHESKTHENDPWKDAEILQAARTLMQMKYGHKDNNNNDAGVAFKKKNNDASVSSKKRKRVSGEEEVDPWGRKIKYRSLADIYEVTRPLNDEEMKNVYQYYCASPGYVGN